MNIQLKDWCWSWNSYTLMTWCEELTHWKRPCCWERLKAEREREDRGWDGWMISVTWWTWARISSRSWWWTGNPGVLLSMGSQRARHDWVTKLNWRQNLTSTPLPRCNTLTFFPHPYKLSLHLNSMLEGSVKIIWSGGVGLGDGREVQERGDVCIHIADLRHCIAETKEHCKAIILRLDFSLKKITGIKQLVQCLEHNMPSRIFLCLLHKYQVFGC